MQRTNIIDTIKNINQEVLLKGWVHFQRDKGKIIFIELRDVTGIVQCVTWHEDKEAFEEAKKLSAEDVVEIIGQVNQRPDNQVKKDSATGAVEISIKQIKLINKAQTLPFEINKDEFKDVNEELRLKYRYLDLRRPKVKSNIILRYKVIKFIRDFLGQKGFYEIETPILTKSTPEGARDYLVPSRLYPGKAFALPQSPQQYKQLLMVAGFERYFQIARCFRDEDSRGDRQPEFTQLDIEMSFCNQEDILNLAEELFTQLVEQITDCHLTFKPFKRLTYKEAMEKYGTDKPDLRKDKNDPKEMAFVWILDWPMFEFNKEENRWDPHHHIFTMPQEQDVPLLDTDPAKVKSWQHDLACNGYEVGGGSIRIHNAEIQKKVLKLVGIDEQEAQEKFGHMLEAFSYGAPPHGGIAPGLDRILMLLAGEPNIREVMAFPKTTDAKDLMMDAPSEVDEKQWGDLNLKSKK
ncbi:MAG: aspartate--tRNA ligase [Patescibacteria group bacterium]|nr:aspartate--tRNA ligase [Patescibacteria group bacterium]